MTDNRVQITEYRVQSTEYRVQITEYRVQRIIACYEYLSTPSEKAFALKPSFHSGTPLGT